MSSKKSGGKKKNKSDKKKKKQTGVAVDAPKLLKELLKTYEQRCEHYNVGVCKGIKRILKTCVEDSKLLHRFLVDPKDRRKVEFWEDDQMHKILAPKDPDEEEKIIKKKDKIKVKKVEPLVKILPLLEAVRNRRYIHIQELFVWEVMVDHDDINILANMLARSIYQFLRIELIDCLVDLKSMNRLSHTFNFCKTLQEIALDFNEFGDDGCKVLCEGLNQNRYLLHLSLAYCNLTKVSGYYLGDLVVKTPIRELLLDGNELEAEGVILLIDKLCQGAEIEAQERLDIVRFKEEQELANKAAIDKKYQIDDIPEDSEELKGDTVTADEKTVPKPPESRPLTPKGKKSKKKKKKGKKKKKNAAPILPPVGPQINILRIADNGIDQMGRGGNFATMRCMQLFKTIISHSKDLEELDLFGNDIGDLGSRQILEGLITRKEQKLPQMGVRVGHRISPDTFDLIHKMAPGIKKKRKGKKKSK